MDVMRRILACKILERMAISPHYCNKLAISDETDYARITKGVNLHDKDLFGFRDEPGVEKAPQHVG